MDKLVFANLKHRRLRTTVCVLGVSLGVCLTVLTTGLAQGMIQKKAQREANVTAQIMVNESGLGLKTWSDLRLPLEEANEIRKIEGVEAVAPVGYYFVSTESGFGLGSVEGVPADGYRDVAGISIIEGRFLNARGNEAIMDVGRAEKEGVRVGGDVKLFGHPFRLVGLYIPESGPRVKIPLTTMQEYTGFSGCSTFLVKCRQPEQQEAVARRIQERLPQRRVILTRDLPAIYAQGTPALNAFLDVVIWLDAIISVLVILLTMYTTIKERTREIGILKSLGASKAFIASVIEKEAFFISFIGVLVGFGLSYLGKAFLNTTTELTITIEAKWLLISMLVGIASGLLGALYPALSAARLDAVKALSYE